MMTSLLILKVTGQRSSRSKHFLNQKWVEITFVIQTLSDSFLRPEISPREQVIARIRLFDKRFQLTKHLHFVSLKISPNDLWHTVCRMILHRFLSSSSLPISLCQPPSSCIAPMMQSFDCKQSQTRKYFELILKTSVSTFSLSVTKVAPESQPQV